MKRHFYLFVVIAFIPTIFGCANTYNNQGEGAALGGVLGAVAGGIIGHQTHDTGAGLLIGGAVGAAGGAVVGSQVPKPAAYPYSQQVVAQPAPVAVAQPPAAIYSQDMVTVNVPNDNGGYTAVVLKKSGNGFVGPQGEYYSQIPAISQLKVMYGN